MHGIVMQSPWRVFVLMFVIDLLSHLISVMQQDFHHRDAKTGKGACAKVSYSTMHRWKRKMSLTGPAMAGVLFNPGFIWSGLNQCIRLVFFLTILVTFTVADFLPM